jgi:hypothetical protein
LYGITSERKLVEELRTQMNVQPNILFVVHEGAPFCRSGCRPSQPTPKGAPFYNAVTSPINAHTFPKIPSAQTGRTV